MGREEGKDGEGLAGLDNVAGDDQERPVIGGKGKGGREEFAMRIPTRSCKEGKGVRDHLRSGSW